MTATEDFQELLHEWGLTPEQMDAAKSIVVLADAPCENLSVEKSNIEGLGTVLRVALPANTVVATAFTQGRFTRAGRFANHSNRPNAKLVAGDFVTLSPVLAGEELTVDYRQVRKEIYG